MQKLLIHQAFCSPSDPGGKRHLELAAYVGDTGESSHL